MWRQEKIVWPYARWNDGTKGRMIPYAFFGRDSSVVAARTEAVVLVSGKGI